MTFQKRILAHLIPILVFLVLTSVYFAPLFSGKVLVQSDNVQLSGTNSEIHAFLEKGETVRWSNREFGGMPRLSGSDYNPLKYIQQVFFYGVFPKPIMMMFALFIGMYILLQVFGLTTVLSALGGFAYAFGSFNLLSIEAGHDNKVIAIAFMAPVLAGIILAYKGKLFQGGLLTFLTAGFQLYYGHIQITYYLLLIVLIYLGFVVWQTVKEKTWKQFLKASGTLAFATLLAVGVNFTKLYSTYEYSDYSTRGGSELTSATGEKEGRTGLDKEYALAWSNGKMETFTLLFPYFHGGASGEKLSKNSATYEELKAKGVPDTTINSVLQGVPLYWGDQPFTGGPIYIGIIIVFLFVVGLFILKGPIKWWGLSVTILVLFLAMGRNFMPFTDLFFYYVPLYNKFRSVTMILSVAQLSIILIAFLALMELFKKEQAEASIKVLLKSAAIVGGIGLFFLVFKGAFFDFSSDKDGQYGFPQWLVNAIVEDRKAKFNQDIIRGLVLIALSGFALWMYLKNRWSSRNLLIGLGLLLVFDFWMVNKRYLGADDFKKKSAAASIIQKTPADAQILRDNSYYRVFNLTNNPFNDGTTSYYHNSIGGYNAIKFQRYQDLIDTYISKVDQTVLNMLNTKYLIVGEGGQLEVQPNSGALGNVWLVGELVVVKNADEELQLVGSFDPANQATIDQRFGLEASTYSGVGTVKLDSYHPENMVYSFESSENQFVVFSEIYYKPGWKAYLDGQKVEHVRVDYVLRGMEVPAGSHEIVFRFEPASAVVGDKAAIVSSILILLWIVGGIFLNRKKPTASA